MAPFERPLSFGIFLYYRDIFKDCPTIWAFIFIEPYIYKKLLDPIQYL